MKYTLTYTKARGGYHYLSDIRPSFTPPTMIIPDPTVLPERAIVAPTTHDPKATR